MRLKIVPFTQFIQLHTEICLFQNEGLHQGLKSTTTASVAQQANCDWNDCHRLRTINGDSSEAVAIVQIVA